MIPKPESAHWLAASVALLIGLLLLSEVLVGSNVFHRRPWRTYLFPVLVLVAGVFLWVVTIFSTFSTMHLLAHSVWAQAAMVAGAVRVAVLRGKVSSPRWSLVPAAALAACGAAFLIHEQNSWLYSRSAFLHQAIGWMLVAGALFPLGAALRPRRAVWGTGFALTFVVLALLLYADRDSAPIFGHFGEIVVR